MEVIMPEVKMRGKNQVTIPASIVEQARLTENCKFDVDYMNGVIIFKPINPNPKKDDVLSYAGLFSGAWGKTTQEVDTTIHNLHNEWAK
jgi:bifunctional DNA-binding transcriptional regulator/antitoxin component of YhaV-PrlF toxin-antitoxin module